MNRAFKIIILITCCITCNTLLSKSSDPEIKKVLISQVVDHPALNMTTQGIIEGLETAGYIRGVNLELRIESAQANAAIASQIANKFVAQDPDIVVGVGTISAQSFMKYVAQKKVKLIFSSVTDPIAAQLIGTTGVSNFVSLDPQLKLFLESQPNLKRLGIIYNPGETNSVSLVQKLEQACAKFNIILVKQSAAKTADVSQAAAKLVGQVDAIFVSNDNTALSSLQSIIKMAQNRKIPVYVSDTDAVAQGAVAALGPNQREIGRQTGRMIAKVLQGAEIGNIPVEFPAKTELYINLKAANLADIPIPNNISKKAHSIIN